MRVLSNLLGLVLISLVTGCGSAHLPPGDSVADPDEVQNRAVHDFNLGVDRAVVRPVANAYGTTVPEPIRDGVSNFAANLDQPRYVVNNLLQLRLGAAFENTARFAINTTLGIGGLLDPATGLGLPAQETDFGETLHVYGVREGAYTVLPLLGPSTSRDVLGMIVDVAMNPVRFLIETPERNYTTAAEIMAQLNNRYEARDTFDNILFESADSYTQLRSLYLQNRRFELGADPTVATPVEPQGDGTIPPPTSSFDPTQDQYYDPYSDPNL